MNKEKRKKPLYKKWWFWLPTVVVIILIYFIFRPQETLFLDVDNNTATLNKKVEAKFNFKTNAGNKYTVTDIDSGQKMGTKTANSGNETLTLFDAGKYKLTVYLNGNKESKTLTVKPLRISTTKLTGNTTSDSTKSKALAFGKGDMVGNGDMVADVTVNSVQKVDPSDSMVVDVSSNYEGMQQYVIVDYTVSSIKGDIPLEDFDGSELSVADSNGTIGTQSSNRDNGTPDTLSEGQNADLRIGVGLKHTGNDVTIKFNNLTWKGQIQ